jgi:hypothetical protein
MDSKNQMSIFLPSPSIRIIFIAAVAATLAVGGFGRSVAQGQVVFQTRVRGTTYIDAPVSFTNGERVGAGFFAQLYARRPGTPVSSLEPVGPILTFNSNSNPALRGYILGPTVTVPDIGITEQATLVMRAFNGSTWEESSCGGESSPITIILGGGSALPATLDGLQPFQVDCIPEPSTIALLLGGGGLLFLKKRLS